MLDILLLALQIITIVLLFLFIWWVVHAARSDLADAGRVTGRAERAAFPVGPADQASWEAADAGQSGAAGEWYGEPPVGVADWAAPGPAPPPDSAARPVPTVGAFDWSAPTARPATADGPAPADAAWAAEPPAVGPRLVVESSPVLQPGTEVVLTGRLGIGRSPDSDLVLADPFVSSTHARVVRRDQGYVVEDLGSKNGTFLNERAIDEARLTPEARLRIGDTVFRFRE